METTKKLGIWMDHASAHLIEFGSNGISPKTITSPFSHQEKEFTLSKSENVMHNKEQHEQADYYKQLGEVIRDYDDVLLFGPTEAKSELRNVLKADHRFEKIKIEVKPADKMAWAQQHDFVKDYFSPENKLS